MITAVPQRKFCVYVDYLKCRHSADNHPRVPIYCGKGIIGSRDKKVQRNTDHDLLREMYGIERFIVFGTYDEKAAYDYEEQLMIELDTLQKLNPSYGCNLVLKSHAKSGWKQTQTARAKIVQNHARPLRGKTAFNKGKPGKKHTADAKEKIARASKGRRPHNKGKRLSKEHRNSISLGLMGNPRKPHTLEAKRKMSAKLKGRKTSQETKQCQSQAMRRSCCLRRMASWIVDSSMHGDNTDALLQTECQTAMIEIEGQAAVT